MLKINISLPFSFATRNPDNARLARNSCVTSTAELRNGRFTEVRAPQIVVYVYIFQLSICWPKMVSVNAATNEHHNDHTWSR